MRLFRRNFGLVNHKTNFIMKKVYYIIMILTSISIAQIIFTTLI